MTTIHITVGAALVGLLLSAPPGAAQIILPNQSGQDLPKIPTYRPAPPPAGVDRSWTLRRGKRGPPPRWERENGFAPPPAYGGPTDAKPRRTLID